MISPPMVSRATIVAEAESWLGTPYRHQASLKGVGCDCLGLVRGIWRAVCGREPGALAGYAVDQALFGPGGKTVEGARLSDLSVQASREGAAIPRVYGRVRLSGQVIWATDYEEVVSEEEQGGKGGAPSATTV